MLVSYTSIDCCVITPTNVARCDTRAVRTPFAHRCMSLCLSTPVDGILYCFHVRGDEHTLYWLKHHLVLAKCRSQIRAAQTCLPGRARSTWVPLMHSDACLDL
jgi:hypothetical protein